MLETEQLQRDGALEKSIEELREAAGNMAEENAQLSHADSSKESPDQADQGEIQLVLGQLRDLAAKADALDEQAKQAAGNNDGGEAEQAQAQACAMRAAVKEARDAISAAPMDPKTGKKRLSNTQLSAITMAIQHVAVEAEHDTKELSTARAEASTRTTSHRPERQASAAAAAAARQPSIVSRVIAVVQSPAEREAAQHQAAAERRARNEEVESARRGQRASRSDDDDEHDDDSIGQRASRAFTRARSSVGAMIDDASENVGRVARGTVEAVRAAPRRIGTAVSITASNIEAVADGDEDKAKANALRTGRGARRALISVGMSENDAQTVGRAVRNVSETVNVTVVAAHTGARGAARAIINEANELKEDLPRRAGTARRLASEAMHEVRNGDMRAAAGTAHIAAAAIGRNMGRAAQSADDIRDAAGDRMARASKFGRELNQLLGSFQGNRQAFDTDRDGKVELHEVKDWLGRHGVTEMGRADMNNNGDLTMAEIALAVRGKRPGAAPANNASPNRPIRNGQNLIS